MAGRLNVNRFEMQQNRLKFAKEEKNQNKERFKRDNYDQDLEKLVRRDEGNNSFIWACVVGFLLFIVIFVLIIIFTV